MCPYMQLSGYAVRKSGRIHDKAREPNERASSSCVALHPQCSGNLQLQLAQSSAENRLTRSKSNRIGLTSQALHTSEPEGGAHETTGTPKRVRDCGGHKSWDNSKQPRRFVHSDDPRMHVGVASPVRCLLLTLPD